MLPSRIIVALTVLLPAASCAPAREGLGAEDVAAIKRADSTYVTAVLGQHWDSLVTLFAPTVTLMAPNEKPVIGVADNLTRLRAFSLDSVEYVHTPIDIVGTGELAYLNGTYRLRMAVSGAPQLIVDQGKYLWVLRKQTDGRWLIERLIWNSNPL
jgi:ketosteroid isomerase-like protein